jgi:hypothetical protein
LAQLGVPFIVELNSTADGVLEEFSVTRKSADDIRSLLQSSDRTLVFS